MYRLRTIWRCAVLVLMCGCLMCRTAAVSADEAVIAVSSSASAAVLYEPTSGTVVYEKNAHERRPMASTTKLMTALLTAETLPLDRVVTVRREALDVIGTSVGLTAGDRVTVKDLLYGLLLASGNDAANVLAFETDGSLEAYAARMNERAAAIGMTDSRFVTPSGLDADGHGASAYDMALLAAEVLKNETLAAICATVTADITISDRMVTLKNHNRLLTELSGCVGMKTGYTSASGRCLVTATRRDGLTLIAVTLNCADDWEEHRVMTEEGFACLKRVELSLTSAHAVSVFGGEETEVAVTAQPLSAVMLRASDTPQAYVTLSPYVWAPIREGERLGTVEYRLGQTTVATAPLVAASDVDAAARRPWAERMLSLWRRMWKTMLSG